jgi:hypothetical protein
MTTLAQETGDALKAHAATIRWWQWAAALAVLCIGAIAINDHLVKRFRERQRLEDFVARYSDMRADDTDPSPQEKAAREYSPIVAIGAGGLAALLAAWKLLLYALREMGRAARDTPPAP